jgi:hypothetical protein
MSTTRILSETSLRFLESAGNSIDVRGGFRVISLRSISSIESDETIEIPDILNSPESLQFCGLSIEASQRVFQKWSEDQQNTTPGQLGYGQDIIEVACQYISGMARTTDAFSASDDWNQALHTQGIKDATRLRIMDPEFRHLRLSASASEWALDTLNLAWEYLDGLDERLKREKKEKDLRSPSPDASVKPSKAINPPTSTSALHSGSSSSKLAVEVEPPMQVPSRSIFYKGGAWTRLISIFQSDGSLNLTDIISRPPCDFHPTSLDLYFTKQLDVAKAHADYAQNRVPVQPATIMTVAVPADFLSSAREVFGTDWKKLVWYSRNLNALMQVGGILPNELKEYEKAEVLIGNICSQSSKVIRKKVSKWDDLEIMVTKPGHKASQIALRGSGMLERFRKECRGYVWVGTIASPDKAKYFPPA